MAHPTDTAAWQEIGWNGIRLQVPAPWHPAVILERYLLFEEDYRPVFEIRWEETGGRFSAAQVLAKLKRSLGDHPLVPWQPPPEWLAAFAGWQAHGFQWCQGATGGPGLLLYNSATARSVLLRFHPAGNTGDEHCAPLLNSLRLQAPGKEHLWAVFDIRALLPARTRLLGQRFLPGSFTIDFRLDHLFVSLLRFRPAAELLRGRSLADFGDRLARGTCQVRDTGPRECTWQSDDSIPRRILRRLQRRKACHLLTVWQIPEKNVILGLRCASNRAIPHDLVQAIRQRYTAS
ncbi:hypothetical protein ACLG6S_08215 [Thermodesulfobacteriota bacterium B35]